VNDILLQDMSPLSKYNQASDVTTDNLRDMKSELCSKSVDELLHPNNSHRQPMSTNLRNLFSSPMMEAMEINSQIADTIAGSCKSQGSDDDETDFRISTVQSTRHLNQGQFRTPTGLCVSRKKALKSSRVDYESRRTSYNRSESQPEVSSPSFQINKKHKRGVYENQLPFNVFNKRTVDRIESFFEASIESVDAGKGAAHSKILRSHSDAELLVKTAVSYADSRQDLIGDFSRPYCLPLIRGKHADLKAISPSTVSTF